MSQNVNLGKFGSNFLWTTFLFMFDLLLVSCQLLWTIWNVYQKRSLLLFYWWDHIYSGSEWNASSLYWTLGNANAISCNWTKTHLSFRASSSSYQFNVISQSVAKNYLFKPPSPFHVIYNWTWKHFLPGIVAVCTNLMWTVAASPWSLYINHLRDFVWSVIGFFC